MARPTKKKGAPQESVPKRFKRIHPKILASYGTDTTLIKWNPATKSWHVWSSYYPHITVFVKYCAAKRVRFKLDAIGFRAEFRPDREFLSFLPFYNQTSKRREVGPEQIKRMREGWERWRKKKEQKLSESEYPDPPVVP